MNANPRPDPDPDVRLSSLVKSLEQRLTGAKQVALRPVGFTVPQYAALAVIAGEPGIGGSELARRCQVSAQTMTTVLTNLVRKGYIERHRTPGEGRAVRATATRAGRTALARAETAVVAVEDRLTRTLSARDHAALVRLLNRAGMLFSAAADTTAPPAPLRRKPSRSRGATVSGPRPRSSARRETARAAAA